MRRAEFPWWVEETRKGWKGFFLQTRPLLVLALAIGIGLFIFDINPLSRPSKNQNDSIATTAYLSNDSDTSASYVAESNLPPVSLLGSLFGIDAIDPLFVIPDTDIQKDYVQQNYAQEPENEPQRSVWNYLVAASDIGFKTNASRLGLALATAEKGEMGALDRLIAEYETDILVYAALIPPKELVETHNATISVLERYVAHMRASRDKTLGSVENTWSGPEREAIAEEAARATEQIRTIVDNLGVVLPAGVLP